MANVLQRVQALHLIELEMSSERFPIDFDNIWEKAGYKNRKHAVDAFKACVQNFNLTEGLEFSRKSGEINIGPRRPRQSLDMTV